MRWFRRHRSRELDLDRELRSDLDLEAEEQEATGLSAEQARHAARRALGNTSLVREEVREIWTWAALERTAQDVRYGLRMLRRNPAFAAAAILALTLGIGANSAVFCVVNAIFLRPLPFRDPGRLVSFAAENRQIGFSGPAPFCDPEFRLWRQQKQLFSDMALFQTRTSNITGGSAPERLLGSAVSVNFFRLLGRDPALGRAFLPEDGTPGHENVLLLSHALWQRRFASDASIIGRSVTLDDRAFTVLGVMPADFQFPSGVDFWTASTLSGDCSNASSQAIARLRPGIDLAAGQRLFAVLQRRMDEERHQVDHGWRISLVSLQAQMSAKLRPTLLMLLAAVALVLLIACANVANLLLARSTARQHEMAARLALGAGPGRLTRQLLTESLCLAAIAGSLGLLIAFATRDALVSLLPAASNQPGFMQPVLHVVIDLRVFGFVFVISTAAAVLFGLVPALRWSRRDVYAALIDTRSAGTSATRWPAARNLFIVAEVALTLVLLVSAGLLARSFIRLRNFDSGFQRAPLLTATVELPGNKYADAATRIRFHDRLLARLIELPRVTQAGTVSFGLPFSGGGLSGDIRIEGQPSPPPELGVNKLVIGGGYFRAIGIPLLKGRTFDNHDTSRSTAVAIVSAAFARQFFSGESPLGRRLDPGFGGSKLYTIIGVVGDVKEPRQTDKDALAVYLPYSQSPRDFLQDSVTVVVRTAGDPLALTNAVRRAVLALDPALPIFEVASMDQLMSRSVAEPRANTLAVGAFATLALLLAVVGIYGLVTYSVAQRTREIGLRIALGATRFGILAMAVRRSLALTLAGVAIGCVASVIATRLLQHSLFGVTASDPVTFAAASVLMMAVSAAAAYIAAQRTVRRDPMAALRYE